MTCCLLLGMGLQLGGCSVIELEDRSFPLLIAVGEEEGDCRLIYKFQVWVVSSKESSKSGGNEQDVVAGSFLEAMEVYQKENGNIWI